MLNQRTLTEYGLAVGATLLALLPRFVLDPWLGDHYPFATVWVAVAVTTWFGGLAVWGPTRGEHVGYLSRNGLF